MEGIATKFNRTVPQPSLLPIKPTPHYLLLTFVSFFATGVNLSYKFIDKFLGSFLLSLYLVLFSVYIIGNFCENVVIKKNKNYILHIFTDGINVSMCENAFKGILDKCH